MTPTVPKPEQPVFKYPSEDEAYVRRFGAALVLHWQEIPEDLRIKLMAEAITVWDREYHVPQIAKKLETFLRRHQPPAKPMKQG